MVNPSERWTQCLSLALYNRRCGVFAGAFEESFQVRKSYSKKVCLTCGKSQHSRGCVFILQC